MKVIFALSLMFAGISFAEDVAENTEEQKVVVKKLLTEGQEEEVALEDAQEEQE